MSSDRQERPATGSTPTLGDLINARFSRREILGGTLGVTALAALAGVWPGLARSEGPDSGCTDAQLSPAVKVGFEEIEHGVDETHHVSPGHRAEVLIRWGDPVAADAPPFDPGAQSAAAQSRQFGYNNDFIGYVPLPLGSENPRHGLLCVNHEYTSDPIMFPGLGDNPFDQETREQVETAMAAHGGSLLEVACDDAGRWRVVADSPYARRITALDTEMAIAGPAAGHERLKTGADPTGARVIGTLNNCAGGITPWGTWLMAEENFDDYFIGELEGHPEQANYASYGIPGGRYPWGRYHQRFDIDAEPNEANRFGWIVEVDPFDPTSVPVKRTALGRFKHEGAECIVNRDGRLVIYSGDDERFQYLYKYVSRDTVIPLAAGGDAGPETRYTARMERDGKVGWSPKTNPRETNQRLLDEGTLSVARFAPDGTLAWVPLVFGEGPLNPANGFHSQADVLIETRRAAALLGATPMDRPEDVEPNPVNGRVYVMLTNNSKRGGAGKPGADAANPRAPNLWGHILEITPEAGDHAAPGARWEVLIQAGDPRNPGVAALWNPATSEHGWFACPDNCAVDPQGRLWVATDQGGGWSKASGSADGLWSLETEGERRGTGRMFFRVPLGAELCGPRFTPDGRTLFLAVQHPGTDGTEDYPAFGRRSTFEDPATRWPDFDPRLPPRPSVVVVTREDGGVIGG